MLPHRVSGKAPAKRVVVHYPDLSWDQGTQLPAMLASDGVVRSPHGNCSWLKEAVSPKVTPTLLLVGVTGAKP